MEDFLGHIGGDDFVAILPHYDTIPICERIINEFDAQILDFYDLEDLATLQIHNRMGKPEPFKCTSLSVAVITNQNQQFTSVDHLSDAVTRVKKQCKKISGSCYLINEYKKEPYLIH